jgi:predicted small lipoprotein YifL
MFPIPSRAGRALLLVGLLALGLAACGRRGALEPPPLAGAPAGATTARAQTDGDDEAPETILPSVSPTPAADRRQQRRGYTVPKEPFILDPLL